MTFGQISSTQMTVTPMSHEIDSEISKTLVAGKTFGVGTSDGEIILLKISDSKIIFSEIVLAHKDAIVELQKSDQIFLSQALDKSMKIWSPTWVPIASIAIPTNLTQIAIAPLSDAIAALGHDSSVFIWTKLGKLAHVCQTNEKYYHLSWKKSGDILALVGENGLLSLFDLFGSDSMNPFFT